MIEHIFGAKFETIKGFSRDKKLCVDNHASLATFVATVIIRIIFIGHHWSRKTELPRTLLYTFSAKSYFLKSTCSLKIDNQGPHHISNFDTRYQNGNTQ